MLDIEPGDFMPHGWMEDFDFELGDEMPFGLWRLHEWDGDEDGEVKTSAGTKPSGLSVGVRALF